MKGHHGIHLIPRPERVLLSADQMWSLTGECIGSYQFSVSITNFFIFESKSRHEPKVQDQDGRVDLMRLSAILDSGHFDVFSRWTAVKENKLVVIGRV